MKSAMQFLQTDMRLFTTLDTHTHSYIEAMNFVPASESKKEKLDPPGNDEIKDGQWLGVTVRSQGVGGKVMVSVKKHNNSNRLR